MKRSRSRAFTLLEVLVALGVLAVALGAMIKTSASNSANAAYLRDKTFGQWVAMNVVVKLQTSTPWPSPGVMTGREEMAGIDWSWRAQVTSTPDADMRRVDVVVNDPSGKQEISHLISYVPRPLNGGSPAL